MKTVLCFGNPYLKGDSLASELAHELQVPGYQFIRCQFADDIFNYKDLEEIYILDVVEGIDNVQLITDIDKIKRHKSLTMHDLDLGFFLKLMKAIGKLEKIKRIGLPTKTNLQTLKNQVEELLSKDL